MPSGFTPSRQTIIATVVFSLAAVLAAAFAGRTPTFQAPDEQAHASYAQELAIGRPPFIDSTDWNAVKLTEFIHELQRRGFPGCAWDGDGEVPRCFRSLSYEDHQPPLYYVLAQQAFTGRDGLIPVWLDMHFVPLSHNPHCTGWCTLNGFEVTGLGLPLRRTSMFLGLVALVLCLATLQAAFSMSPTLPITATAFIAFLPMYAYMSAVVNNDALANAVMALALLAAVRRLAGRTTRSRYVAWSGLLWGAALLTKMTVYPVILPLAAAELLRSRREDGHPRHGVAPVTKSIALGLLVAGPWFIRNMVVYGPTDPFGLAAHNRVVVGQPRTADWIAQHGWGGYLERAVVFTFDSFWGVFGWMSAFMDGRVYIVLALSSVVMAIGFAGYARRAWRAAHGGRHTAEGDVVDGTNDDDGDVGPLQRDVLVVFGLVVATTVAGYVWYNLTFVQHQGRYLFPALIPLATAGMLGIREWARWLAAAVRRPAWAEGIALAGMAAFDGGLLATSVWALVHVIPSLWPGG